MSGPCPPDARRTYGYARFEALGALANGMLLFALAGYILWEAWQRFRVPLPVASLGMLVVAVVNFPPRQIGPVKSEVLTLGFPDANGEVVLVGVDRDLPLGGRLF